MPHDLLQKPVPVYKPDESDSSKESKKKDSTSYKKKAYETAYFNHDVKALYQTNFRSSKAVNLRGGEGATDLKKIVLPLPSLETPDPKILMGVIELMKENENNDKEFKKFLYRHSTWLHEKGVSKDMINDRIHQLEMMVQDRKIALDRIKNNVKDNPLLDSSILSYALEIRKKNYQNYFEDIISKSTFLIHLINGKAKSMYKRISKSLGI